ncbi:MAG: oxidoreductase [Acidimicrobiaceae bacterium]|nr:oxidoreductase [Acidimicrobiaceae bacterium]|tara:strand:+ start:11929 stop:12639 length:711 start_codon:yes stop_codon:yes gene_type:complete
MHAVITGGAQGIGLACAQHLTSAGWRVTLLDKDNDLLEQSSSELGCQYAQVDITDLESVKKFFSSITHLDALINNAGIWIPQKLEDMNFDDQKEVLEVNILGTLLCTSSAIHHLRNSSSGSVVNISSLAARTNSPGLGLYAASKSAVETLTKQWALEIAPIRVNAVAPGLIETPGTSENYKEGAKEKRAKAVPLGRVGESSDIAKVVLFLVSEASAYVTGQIVYVDGGLGAGTPQR